MRATMSVVCPAGNPTSTRSVFWDCARAGAEMAMANAPANAAIPATTLPNLSTMVFSPEKTGNRKHLTHYSPFLAGMARNRGSRLPVTSARSLPGGTQTGSPPSPPSCDRRMHPRPWRGSLCPSALRSESGVVARAQVRNLADVTVPRQVARSRASAGIAPAQALTQLRRLIAERFRVELGKGEVIHPTHFRRRRQHLCDRLCRRQHRHHQERFSHFQLLPSFLDGVWQFSVTARPIAYRGTASIVSMPNESTTTSMRRIKCLPPTSVSCIS